VTEYAFSFTAWDPDLHGPSSSGHIGKCTFCDSVPVVSRLYPPAMHMPYKAERAYCEEHIRKVFPDAADQLLGPTED
jgi:hypothetical protein